MQDNYILASGASVDDLTDEVNRKINDGYQPIGGVAVYPMDNRFILYQAMILTVKATGTPRKAESW